MKKIIITLFVAAAIAVSCKNEEKQSSENEASEKELRRSDILEERADRLKVGDEVLLRGEYIYTEEAAVLYGNDFVYGVTLDEKAKELAQQVESYKREDFETFFATLFSLVFSRIFFVHSGETSPTHQIFKPPLDITRRTQDTEIL